MNWKTALSLAVGWVYLRYKEYRSYRLGYSNAYYQGRMDELDSQNIALFYMHEKDAPLSENEQQQILAQQITQDPLLENQGEWDGIDRLSLYTSLHSFD